PSISLTRLVLPAPEGAEMINNVPFPIVQSNPVLKKLLMPVAPNYSRLFLCCTKNFTHGYWGSKM
ncbi:MAG: hypothetical protein ACI85Z_000098, partial [Rheinheimera aquimaris]